MECRKCNGYFPAMLIVNGIRKNLSNRKYCLDCSPYKQHNNRKLECLIDGKKQCPKCLTIKDVSDFYSRGNNLTYSYCISCWNKLSTLRQKDTKRKCVEYKGGSCIICGYNKCNAALEFHHLDPNEKDFEISSKLTSSWEKIQQELDKCILVCSNCHGEIHEGLHTNLMHGWSSGEGIALQKQDININGSSPLPCSNGLII